MSANSILIVDDDVDMLRRLRTAFANAGYKVHTATDGEIALRGFKAAAADVVLIDILMPNREGLETIMAMRNQQPETRIVAMSGGGRIGPLEFLNVALHLGADAVIAKPFRLADVVALVAHTRQRTRSRPIPEMQA